MYGDSEIIRRRAQSVRDQGTDIQALADELVARIDGIGWTGRAAVAMRERVSERANQLRSAAARHEGAADALSAHSEAVETAKDEIATTEARVAALLADAQGRLEVIADRNANGEGPRISADPLDEDLLALDLPPRGHRDWLSIDVPGQER